MSPLGFIFDVRYISSCERLSICRGRDVPYQVSIPNGVHRIQRILINCTLNHHFHAALLSMLVASNFPHDTGNIQSSRAFNEDVHIDFRSLKNLTFREIFFVIWRIRHIFQNLDRYISKPVTLHTYSFVASFTNQ